MGTRSVGAGLTAATQKGHHFDGWPDVAFGIWRSTSAVDGLVRVQDPMTLEYEDLAVRMAQWTEVVSHPNFDLAPLAYVAGDVGDGPVPVDFGERTALRLQSTRPRGIIGFTPFPGTDFLGIVELHLYLQSGALTNWGGHTAEFFSGTEGGAFTLQGFHSPNLSLTNPYHTIDSPASDIVGSPTADVLRGVVVAPAGGFDMVMTARLFPYPYIGVRDLAAIDLDDVASIIRRYS